MSKTSSTQATDVEELEAKKKAADLASQASQTENNKYFKEVREIFQKTLDDMRSEKIPDRDFKLCLFSSLSLVFPIFIPFVVYELAKIGFEKTCPETQQRIDNSFAAGAVKDRLGAREATSLGVIKDYLGIDYKQSEFSRNIDSILAGANPLNFSDEFMELLKTNITKEELAVDYVSKPVEAAPKYVRTETPSESASQPIVATNVLNPNQVDRDGIGGTGNNI